MKTLPNSLFRSLFTLFILTACATATPAAATPSPQPTATEVRILPTPASPSDSIIWRDLQVTLVQTEITENFITEFGSTRKPPAGTKLMWLHVQIKNVGLIEIDIPRLENFSVLYAATEIKPTYGHRAGYLEYSKLELILFPNQAVDGWIRFDIPTTAELTDLLCVFLPESAQIGTSFSSPNYPYSGDKPTYVWKCGR